VPAKAFHALPRRVECASAMSRQVQRPLHISEGDRAPAKCAGHRTVNEPARKRTRQLNQPFGVKPQLVAIFLDDLGPQRIGGRAEVRVLLPGDIRFIREHVGHRGVEPLEEGQQLSANAIARDRQVVVGLVEDKLRLPLGEICVHLASAALEKGPNHDPVTRVHRRQAAGTGASQQPQEERLGLVVPCMPHRDHVASELRPRLLEEAIASRPGRIFDRPAFARGDPTHIPSTGDEGRAQIGCHAPAERFVAIGRDPKPVIEVRKAGHLQFTRSRQTVQEAGQRDGVRPTGDRDDDAGIRGGKLVPPDRPPDAGR
jgi:hypothetical protein